MHRQQIRLFKRVNNKVGESPRWGEATRLALYGKVPLEISYT